MSGRAGGRRAALALWFWGQGAGAMAAPFYVEGPAHSTEEAAARELTALLSADPTLTGARVVRRYAANQGWRYLVHVDGIPDLAALRRVQGRYPSGQTVAIDVETGLQAVDAKGGGAPPPSTEAAPAKARWWQFGSRASKPDRAPSQGERSERGGGAPSPSSLLQAAVAAHGGGAGGKAAMLQADHIRFRYRRTLVRAGSRITAEHLWVRAGADRRLDVRILEGEGADSTTVVRGTAEAWVQAGGQRTARPTAKAMDLIDQFGPMELMSYPLGFAVDIETAGAWRGLELSPGATGQVVELRPAVPTRGLTAVGLHKEGGHVAFVEMTQPNGVVRFEYSDYRDLGKGVVLPFLTRLSRDGVLLEELTVLDCDIDATVPSTTFDRPE